MIKRNKLLSFVMAAVLLLNTAIGSGIFISTVIAADNGSDSKMTDFVTSIIDIDELLASKYSENIPLGYNDYVFSFYQPGWGFDENRIHFNLTPTSTSSSNHDQMINSGWSMPVTVTANGEQVTVSDADFIPSYVTSKGGDSLSVVGYKYVAENNMIAVILEATNNTDAAITVTVNATLGGAVKGISAENGVIRATYFRDSLDILDIRAEGDGFTSSGNDLTKTVSVQPGQTVSFRVGASFDRENASAALLDTFFADSDPLSTQKETYNDWFTDNIPYIDVPDADIQRIYYYRWHTYRSQIRLTLDGDYVITEFLPNVSWARTDNAIVCAAGHHIYEGRWLRNGIYMNDYMEHWFNDGKDAIYLYSSWLADAYYQCFLANGNTEIANYLDKLIEYYKYFTNNSARYDSTLGLYKMNGGSEGMECSVSDPNNSYNSFRATFNSYMYANALAIAELAKLKGNNELYNEYTAKAEAIRTAIEKIWDSDDNFYKALHYADGDLVDVREQYGFVPWMFNMPMDDIEHSSAWNDFMNADTGFFAKYGPLTAEREYAKPSITNTCNWDGPSWPFATTQTLIAMSNLINNYETNTAITSEDYYTILVNYAKSQYKDCDGDGIRETPWIGESLDAYTGEWIQNRQRSSYYNHSQFANLVITGLFGVKPDGDNTFDTSPLVPSDWDYFCLENLPYHGHNVTVVYDKDGSHYGAGAGLTVYVDGEKKANESGIKAMSVELGEKPENSKAYSDLLELYNANKNRDLTAYVIGTEEFENAISNAKFVLYNSYASDNDCKSASDAIKAALMGLKRGSVYRVEAESGTLYSSNIANNAAASGGQFVGGLGGSSSSEKYAYVEMKVKMPRAGTYTMKLAVKSSTQYAAASGSGNNLSINGSAPVTLSYPVSDTFIIHEVRVALNEGENTVRISGIPDSNAWAQLDYIEFDLLSSSYKIEAESGQISGTANIAERNDASGGKFVAGLGGQSLIERDAYVLLDATVSKGGKYKMTLVVKSSVQYATSTGSANNVSVNGAAPITVTYPVSDSFISHEIYIDLNSGNNTIKISGIPESPAWAQVDYIELEYVSTAVKIEAESGQLDGAVLSTNGNPSGGKAVGGIGGTSLSEQKASVTLKITAPKAGCYNMTLVVNSAAGATSGHNLSINGKSPVTLSYPGSATYIPVDVIVELEEGENTVKVSGIPGSGAWARLDYIEVDFSKIIKRYEAEDGAVVGNNTYRADHNDASGGKFVAGLGGGSTSEQNGSTTMTVNVPAAGVYTIRLRVKSIPQYITEAGSGNNLTINGEAPITLSYPVSETFIYHEVSVSLNAGENTVKVSGIPGSAAWAQLDCIDVYIPNDDEADVSDFSALYDAYVASKPTYDAGLYCMNEQGIAFTEAFKNAEAVLCEPMSIQDDIDSALEALVNAANALEGNTDHIPEDVYSYDEHGHWISCSVCDKTIVSSVHKGGEADCLSGAICQFCGYEYTDRNADNHVDAEGSYTVLGNGTHSFNRACCDENDIATENCEYGDDNICDKCGYDRTVDIETEDVKNAFNNAFNGGENNVTVVGPTAPLGDEYKVGKIENVVGYQYALFNVHFDENGKVFLRHHFIITGDVTITVNGEVVELINVEGTNIYYFDTEPAVGMYHVADKISVNGDVYEVSLYSYIKIALESGTLNEKQETLLRALYDLNEAAK